MIQYPFHGYWNAEAKQDRTQVSDFHKAINVSLKDNLIRKLKEYRRCHHQMRSIRCSVTLAVLYGAQLVECLAGQEYLWIQVQKWYHLLYMDDIKLYAKNEQDTDSLIHLTRVFSSDIGMTFGLAKCGRLIVNRGKVKSTCGISLPEGQIDESYKYLGILQSFGNNDEEVRCKATSEYRNRVRGF